MTLLYLDGFDSYVTSYFAAKGWNVGGSPTIATTQARTGAQAMRTTAFNPSQISRSLAVADEHATVIIGFALYLDTLPSDEAPFAYLSSDAGATSHLTLSHMSTGAVRVRRGDHGGTILGTSSPGAVVAAGWRYVEFKGLLSDTVGTVDVRVNGASVLSLTSQDTKNGGTKTVFDTITLGRLSSLNNGPILNFDDFYLANGAGSVNNTFIGDLRVRLLAPNGNGNSSQFVGSDGNSTNNYLLVDDPTPDLADYVGSPTLNDKDTYAFADLPDTSGTVVGAQISALATKTDAATRNLALVTRSAGTDYDGSDVALALSSNIFVQQIRETDPATGVAWLRAAINSAEFGVKVR